MIVTLAIIMICIIIYVIIHFIDKSEEKNVLAIKYGAFYAPKIEIQKQYWRFLTANFVHVDIAHLFMNCYGIFYLGGRFFEPYLGIYVYMYLVLFSGICSSIVTYLYIYYNRSYENIITLGASGIFYGFLGAMVTLGVVFQGPFLRILEEFIFVIIVNVAYTLLNKNVSKTGHLGGFIGGVIAMLMLIVTGVCVY